jgi:anti-sigma factor RsiW
MTCEEARPRLDDARRRRLEVDEHARVEAHLAGCADCAHLQRSELALDEALARLPCPAAPDHLRRRLTGMVAGVASPPAPEARSWVPAASPALLAAAVLLVAAGALFSMRGDGGGDPLVALTREAVSDHLRVMVSEHPLDVESGATHQVKPWFEGRLDFAPDVPLGEGTGLVLRGGSVGYFLDRKAAVVAYGLRQHRVTLLVFPSEGLEGLGPAEAGGAPAAPRTRSHRGFHALFWRSGELAYALVSDLNPAELAQVASRLAAETAPLR